MYYKARFYHHMNCTMEDGWKSLISVLKKYHGRLTPEAQRGIEKVQKKAEKILNGVNSENRRVYASAIKDLFRIVSLLIRNPAALDRFISEAKAGDVIYQFLLGRVYNQGAAGMQQDLVEAERWYKLSAQQGNVEAQYKLGSLYLNGGPGVPQNLLEAEKWLKLAAEQGDIIAQYNLGSLYFSGGPGVPKNLPESEKWLKLAAEQGDMKAQYNLGRLYLTGGSGVPKNVPLAEKLLKLAAEQGNVKAQCN